MGICEVDCHRQPAGRDERERASQWIAPLGLYDYRNRTYSPTLGRFLQTDPIRFDARDANLYRYVSNNPVNWVDPDGLLFNDLFHGLREAQQAFDRLKNEDDGWYDPKDYPLDSDRDTTHDKAAHCYAHCEITKDLLSGKEVMSFAIGYGKELVDGGIAIVINIVNKIRTMLKKNKIKAEWTGYDRKDIAANKAGQECANDPRGCECCCNERYPKR
jgi:RHS repeat-associated protein